ncbi:hypothetical protein BC831DRAFT_469212 [Entophlyctis helioformis]|nr:hypothetical protein BC831DRAFT_469212 [Entophlyctis helioformis]
MAGGERIPRCCGFVDLPVGVYFISIATVFFGLSNMVSPRYTEMALQLALGCLAVVTGVTGFVATSFVSGGCLPMGFSVEPHDSHACTARVLGRLARLLGSLTPLNTPDRARAAMILVIGSWLRLSSCTPCSHASAHANMSCVGSIANLTRLRVLCALTVATDGWAIYTTWFYNTHKADLIQSCLEETPNDPDGCYRSIDRFLIQQRTRTVLTVILTSYFAYLVSVFVYVSIYHPERFLTEGDTEIQAYEIQNRTRQEELPVYITDPVPAYTPRYEPPAGAPGSRLSTEPPPPVYPATPAASVQPVAPGGATASADASGTASETAESTEAAKQDQNAVIAVAPTKENSSSYVP